MYQALYRKWRPQTFSDVVGQYAITETIKTQIETGRLSHAYLFAGSRGTGKTTCAKILAKAVNCEHPIHGDPCNQCSSCLGIQAGSVMDVVEIDAASNNGVDGVRELREEAIYSPATAKKRVYIIDEVHMFSNSAFNALLKILEEPPEHVLFILATTELHKVPATILSRCQRFTFKRIETSEIRDRILHIARSEEIQIDANAAEFIASLADGGMRDALSIFDQCASYGHASITRETVEDVVGLAGATAIASLVDTIAEQDTASALSQLAALYNGGRDLISVLSELSGYLRDLLIEKIAPESKIRRMNIALESATWKRKMDKFGYHQLVSMISTISTTLSTIGTSTNKRIDAELCIIKLCMGDFTKDETVVLQRIEALEKKFLTNSTVLATKGQGSTQGPVVKPVDNVDNSKKASEKTVQKPIDSCPPIEDNEKKISWSSLIEAARPEFSPALFPLLRAFRAEQKGSQLFLSSDNTLAKNMLNHREHLTILENMAQKLYGSAIVIRIVENKDNMTKNTSSQFDTLCEKLKTIPDVTIVP